MLSAVIFDFDGIIVDTEALHFQAIQTVLKPLGRGFSWQEYCSSYLGFDDRDIFRKALGNAALTDDPGKLRRLVGTKTDAFQAFIQAGKIHPYAGAVELIHELAGQVPLALCSGGVRRDIEPILEQLGIAAAFHEVVTAEDTAVSKPDPAPYLLAVARLGLDYARSALAIEDTIAGISSAKRAGLRVLAVANSYQPNQLKEADKVTHSLEKISLGTLENMIF